MTDISSLKFQNDLLTQEVKRRVDQLAAINTVAATVSQSLDLDATLDTALTAVLEIVGAEAGGISLIDQETREVVVRAQHGWTRDLSVRPMRIPVDKGMSGRVIRNDDVIIDNNLDNSDELAVPSFMEEHFRSIVMAPMHARGEIIGILSIMSSQANHFDNEISGVLRAIADTVGVALGNAQLYESTVESENNLTAILDSTSDGIIATDQKSRIRLINDEAAKMFRVNPQELRGTPLQEIPIAPRVRELLLRALQSKSGDKRQSFEVTLDADLIVSVTVSPVYVETQLEQKATTNGWVMVLHDVTHLRKAEKARAQFIAAAAHDMRSPLGVTINAIKLLETMIDLSDPTVAELIELADNGVIRLQALIDDVLRLEQIEAGLNVDNTEIDVNDLLQEASRQIKPVMASNDVTFLTDIDGHLPPLHTDAQLLTRAVLNYLENAAKYTAAGGSVTLRAFVNGSALHIEVTDDGPGIPLQDQSRLFERFYRAPGTRNLPGTGLGLAIVKSVAESNGGDVYIRSSPGQGSTFGMTIAIEQAD